MVPEPEGFNALLHQNFFARFIPSDSSRQTTLKTVEFDIQLCNGAIEIQNMPANCVLPTKFEAGELSATQCPPKPFFFISLIVAQPAGNLFKAHAGRMQVLGKNSSSSPRPSPRLARRG